MAPNKQPRRFDPALFDVMSEPFSVRVERRHNGSNGPIPLPPADGEDAGGIGYDRDRVLNLEQWLVTDWSGGGTYFFTLSDASDPPKRMEWVSTFDPRTYPVRVPPDPRTANGTVGPPLPPPAAAVAPPAPVQAPAPAPAPQPPSSPSVNHMSTQTPWPTTFQYQPGPAPAAAPAPVAVQQPQFQQQPQQPQGQSVSFYPPYGGGTMMSTRMAAANDPGTGDRARMDQLEAANRDLQARLAAEETARREAQHKAEMERQAAVNRAELERIQRESDRKLDELKASLAPKTDPVADARLAKLETVLEKIVDKITAPKVEADPRVEQRFSQMERLLEKLADKVMAPPPPPPPAPTGPSPEMVALQTQVAAMLEQNRLLQQRLDREAASAEQDRRDHAHAEALRTIADTNRQQIDALERRLSEMATGAKNDQQTPLLRLFEDMQRQHTDTIRELRGLTMTPQQIVALMADRGQGIDEVRATMTKAMTDIFGMQRMAVQTVLESQPSGGPSTGQMIQEGIGQAADLVKKYFTTKTQQEVVTQQTQQALIEAEVRLRTAPPPIAHVPFTVNQDLNGQAYAQASQPPMQQPQFQPQPQQMQQQPQPPSVPQAQAPQPIIVQDGPPPASAIPAPMVVVPQQQQPSQMAEAAMPVTGPTPAPTAGSPADLTLFGLLMPQVNELRHGVYLYLQALREGAEGVDPKNGKHYGVSAKDAAKGILMAGAELNARPDVRVAAYSDLFMKGQINEFVTALLPDPIPQAYRGDVVEMLTKALSGIDIDAEDDEDDDDDEDEGAAAQSAA